MTSRFAKLPALCAFLPFYIKEVVLSNLRVARDILLPHSQISPGIVALRLDPMTDLQLLMLTNLITMTPGTLSLEVSEDRATLYIHSMYAGDGEDPEEDMRNLERRIRNAF